MSYLYHSKEKAKIMDWWSIDWCHNKAECGSTINCWSCDLPDEMYADEMSRRRNECIQNLKDFKEEAGR